ncbi:hypothetical protein GCM10011492_24370 [Flexivirga endophytica]|uniref:Uncharacterized protein n=1 Tax=Flexivirga endophytica TaxID=1849103 RepID=A0A916T5X0_9MICO|nr:hypothetical protein [Flexivirga endophytica]GGB32898.1 hypothetical protein GCM10011492_24370 [Flexivirga endophytica]GHB40895.1 hypothetical protein GCM10008112_06760 [Flexivirga endophytica]
MKWLLPVTVAAMGVAFASRRGTREEAARFRDDVRHGMGAREAQLREVLAMDTHLTLPGERVADGRDTDARAIEGR